MKKDRYLEKLVERAADGDRPEAAPEGPIPLDSPRNPGPRSRTAFAKLSWFGSWSWAIHGIAVAVAGMLLFFEPWRTVAMVVGGYAAVVVVHALVNLVRYWRFRSWQERLPFALRGWDALLEQKRVFCDLCWTDVNVVVDAAEEVKPYVQAALRLFCGRAKRSYYEAETGSPDRRQDWTVVGDVAASGRASMEVLRRLRGLLDGDLARIARRTGGVRAVAVQPRGDEYTVKIEIRGSIT